MRFEEYKKEALKDPEVKMYYDALQPQYDLLNQLIEVRKEKGVTQKELAELSGLKQSNISRFENGGVSPTFESVAKIARALGYSIQFTLKPLQKV